jgi:hypothetical protein
MKERYVGVKLVEAEPMDMSDAENEGHKVGNAVFGDDGYEVTYPDGYKSWCPKEQFEAANRHIEHLTFGHALELAKLGHKIRRVDWNGAGQYLFISCPEGRAVAEEYIWSEAGREVARMHKGVAAVMPYMMIKTVSDAIVPWAPSQTDMLTDDWVMVV